MMPGRLGGKVALVTGASRGIGRAIAVLFAHEGASVVVNYAARHDAAMSVVEEIRKDRGEARAIQADVTDRSQVLVMLRQAMETLGAIDILVNNAGLFRPAPMGSIDDETLDALIAVNLKGVIHCTKAVTPGMIERKSGKIVNISSIAALGTAAVGTTAYAATKAAMIALTKRCALEMGPHGINVNAICPGFVVTDMALGSAAGNVEQFSSRAVLRRVGRPEDVAYAALYLASEEASFVTAQVLTVDGGRMDFLSHSA
jgi:3-oxoacyl-[acyl-carrier protein] reductase